MPNNESFKDRVAIITGGARGQGRSHALALAERGADIVVCDLASDMETVPYPLGTPEELDETRIQVEKFGRRCLTVTADVRSSQDMNGVAQRALEEFGRIDILLANAGISSLAPVVELSDQHWDEMIAVNLTGVFNSMRAVVPSMVERGYGRIIATSSMAGRAGVANLAHYVAAKWGVIGLVKSLAYEVATQGITVNALLPTNVDTQMLHNADTYARFRPDLTDPDREAVRSAFESMSPMGTAWLDPSEISAAVMYLASEDARHISGSALDISAGSSAGLT